MLSMESKNQKRTPSTNTHQQHLPDAPPIGTDYRVARALRAANLDYDLLQDGTYIVQADLANEKECAIYASSKTYWIGSIEVRLLVARAGEWRKPLPIALAEALLEANAQSVTDKWELINAGDSWIIVLSRFLRVDADTAEFVAAIQSLADSSDLPPDWDEAMDCH